jgi:hypothetical protein
MNKFTIAGFFLLGAVLGGGIAYVAENRNIEFVKADLNAEIKKLSDQIVSNQAQYLKDIAEANAGNQRAISLLNKQVETQKQANADVKARAGLTQYPSQHGEVLKLIYPKGGEVFCLGKEMKIQWEGSTKNSIVNLYLIDPKNGGEYLEIGAVPFTYGGVLGGTKGSYIWTVGELPKDPYVIKQRVVAPGDAYRIQVTSTYSVSTSEGLVVYDYNETPISIGQCE